MSVSVVVPALNEERLLSRALASVREADEVLVVDGGSFDSTRRVAEQAGARVIVAPRGRGPQLDRGAREARGDWIVFLHADTWLEAGWRPAVSGLGEGIVGGAFRFALDGPRGAWRGPEWAVALRCRLFGLPFGDQALFCRREAYAASGGFPHEPLFEDVAFVRRLRRVGRIVMLELRAVSSPRRYQTHGPAFTTLRNNALLLLFFAGVKPARLAPVYEAGTPRRGVA